MPTTTTPPQRPLELGGQTVAVIGGSAGIGLETARQARAAGAEIILAARDPEHLKRAADQIGARQTAAFDANNIDALGEFFDDLPTTVDHVMVTAGGPAYLPLATMDLAVARQALDRRLAVTLAVALHSRSKVRPGGTLIFMGGTNGSRPAVGNAIVATLDTGMRALIANLALELAPIRANLIAPGFVDTGLSASLLGGALETRRQQLRSTLPIGRVVGPSDVAALAVHLMSNGALTGATYDVDGGEQLLSE
jgi:NAD(P)-dependent dehydrogenase (short-subunit alcohol dehydrogenase family)